MAAKRKNKAPAKRRVRRVRKYYSKQSIMDALQVGGLTLAGLIVGSMSGGMLPIKNNALRGALVSLAGFFAASSSFGKSMLLKPFLIGFGTIGLYSVAKEITGIPTLAGGSMGALVNNTGMNGLVMNGDSIDTESAFFSSPGDLQ